ncbi:Bro-N domain-containing protein [Xenorhabdus hominickii]|uniref:Antirepressor n=1 Tax=Xenorhabdus hominickii TaxID=351679 RepID=A0A2G0Q148_XENHO|nr:BRO family protein [Xenorhabdus hominickii]PHM52943.1 antirepressor [Xenorhabdus hominickii]
MTSIAISKTNNTNQLTFRSTVFNPVSHANKIWFTAAELAKALEYKKSDAVTQIYDRNSDEFTSAMTTTLNLSVVRKTGTVSMMIRVFSLRGAHLIAMFSKTSVAKEFRKWVLDILDREVEKEPVATKPKTRRSTASQLTPLRQTAERLITTGLGRIYPDIWKLVHEHFEVKHITQLEPSQITEAIEFLNVLEGEYLGKEESPVLHGYSGFSGKLLMQLENGKVVYSSALTPKHHVATINDFMEIAQRAGYLLIHKEDMQPMMKALEGYKFRA